MKKLFLIFASLCLPLTAAAQNWTTVTANNITDLNQQKLATGQLCFLATDQNDVPISFNVGGGGQALRRPFCSPVTAGVATSFTVPNPATTSPSGIYYRVTAQDLVTGQEVLRYTQVSFTGTTFSFDNYAPANLGYFAPLTGTSVTGNLSVTGNISATGTVTGSNSSGSSIQQIFNSGAALTQRTAANFTAGITCSDNVATSRTDCRLGTLTTVAFSATPVFDASAASTFKLTLTGNATSSTLTNAVAGQPLGFEICQDAVGGRTFVPPANVLNFVTIPSAASACIFESFVYDGANAQADQSVAGKVLAVDGAAAAPSIAFTGQTGTGLFRPGTGNVGISASGTQTVNFGTNVTLGSNRALVWANGTDPFNLPADVGLSRTAAATLALGNGTLSDSSGYLLARNFAMNAGSPALTAGDGMVARTATTGYIFYGSDGGKALGRSGNVFDIFGFTGGLLLYGATSGTETLTAPAAASGQLTLPAANDTLVGRATTDTLINKTIDAEAVGNTITLPFYVQVPAATCNNATATNNWDLPTTNAPVPTCLTGTNSQQASADFDDTAARTMQTSFALPPGWTGNVDVDIFWLVAAGGGANTVKFTIATACSAPAATFDPIFNTANTITSGTVGANNAINVTSQTAITMTGCAPGNVFHIKFGRDNTDTSTATVKVLNVAFTIRRAM